MIYGAIRILKDVAQISAKIEYGLPSPGWLFQERVEIGKTPVTLLI